MIAVDTNILVYAHRYESEFDGAAFRCLSDLMTGRDSWGIPWPCIHEFLAVVTNPKAFRPATPLEEAFEQVDVWLAAPSVALLGETEEHWNVVREALRSAAATGGAVHDARIAALCREHGVRELWTADRDFARFPGLVTFNPLVDDRVHETSLVYGATLRARAAGRRRATTARPE